MNKERYFGTRSMAELAAMQTVQAGEMIAEPGNFDMFAGDLIARNLFVLTDRLSAAEFKKLSAATKAEIEEVVRYITVFHPLDADDILQSSVVNESAVKYQNEVLSPLLKFQTVLRDHKINSESGLDMLIAQKVVSTASTAFAHAVIETEALPFVNESMIYFNDNATAALNRLNTLQSEPYFS